jgi:glycosyltransferase involved in cell wall biosynthesis
MPRANEDAGIGVAHENGMLIGWDVSVFKLMMHQAVPGMFRKMQARGERIIVDIDDFHYGLHEENVAYSATNPHLSPDNNRAFYEIGIRLADTVTVSTDFLADFYSRRCRDVRIIRNALDTARYEAVEQPETPTIGWVGGTWWRSGDIELLREWLPAWSKDHNITVHHSGHIPGDPHHFGVRAGLKRVQTTVMHPIAMYPELLKKFHIGLVPLTRTPFNEAKSFLKGLEYAASGIPFIATPTDEYRLLYRAGVGRLAETADEWRDHATELLDPQVRREEAERQRKIVQKQFDISLMGPEWDIAMSG